MNNPLFWTLLFAARLELFTPIEELPYLAALPADYPDKATVVEKYCQKAADQRDPELVWTHRWNEKQATRLFLADICAEEGPDRAGYLLGRMRGRNWLFGTVWSKRAQWWKDVWLDEWDGE